MSNSSSDSSSETESTEQSVSSSSTSSQSGQSNVWRNYFSYSRDKDNVKDSNTSGLRKHLLSCHPKIYNDAFKMKITSQSSQQLANKQLTINQAFQ